jgi:hypothetical protein
LGILGEALLSLLLLRRLTAVLGGRCAVREQEYTRTRTPTNHCFQSIHRKMSGRLPHPLPGHDKRIPIRVRGILTADAVSSRIRSNAVVCNSLSSKLFKVVCKGQAFVAQLLGRTIRSASFRA